MFQKRFQPQLFLYLQDSYANQTNETAPPGSNVPLQHSISNDDKSQIPPPPYSVHGESFA